METNDSELKCQDCGKVNATVEKTACPFADEIHDKIEHITVCKECFKKRLYEI